MAAMQLNAKLGLLARRLKAPSCTTLPIEYWPCGFVLELWLLSINLVIAFLRVLPRPFLFLSGLRALSHVFSWSGSFGLVSWCS